MEHLADNEFASWNDYIDPLAQDRTYGDQLTLFAAANLYNIDIVSSLGAGGQHLFRPSASISTAAVYLGDFAENQGEHYVSSERVMADNDNGEEESGESKLEDLIGNPEMGDTVNVDDIDVDIRDGADDLGDVVVEVKSGDQTDQTEQLQNEQIAVQFVSDGDVGLLAPRMNGNCNIENLPNEV